MTDTTTSKCCFIRDLFDALASNNHVLIEATHQSKKAVSFVSKILKASLCPFVHLDNAGEYTWRAEKQLFNGVDIALLGFVPSHDFETLAYIASRHYPKRVSSASLPKIIALATSKEYFDGKESFELIKLPFSF